MPETDKEFGKNDLCVLADVRFKIWKQLKFNARYAYSLLPIKTGIQYQKTASGSARTDTWERNFYNSTLTFRLLWVFNEKENPNKRRPK